MPKDDGLLYHSFIAKYYVKKKKKIKELFLSSLTYVDYKKIAGHCSTLSNVMKPLLLFSLFLLYY